MDGILFGHKYIFGDETEPLVPIRFEVFQLPKLKIIVTCFTPKQYKKYEKHMEIAKVCAAGYITKAQEQGIKMPKPREITLHEGDQIKEVLS